MIHRKQILMLSAALCLAVAPAFGQHPHGGAGGGAGGAGGSHGAAMSNGAADHGNSASSAKGTANSPTMLLTNNTKLDNHLTSKLQAKGLLPAGTDLKDACAGFKNLGQCVAALHVSHNLKVPFACMKANMTGAAPATAAGTTCPAGTGSSKMSLGKSIQALEPTADSKTASKLATKQADADIKDAQTAS